MWWSNGVPNLIRLLRHQLAEKEKWLAEDELIIKKLNKERVPIGWWEESVVEAAHEAEEEVKELKKQLQEAKGREDALLEVIDRCRWGERAEGGGKRPRSSDESLPA